MIAALLCAGRAPLRSAGIAFYGIAVDPAGVLSAIRSKADLIAVELTVDRRNDVAVFERAGDHLKSLLDRQLALGQLPCAADFCRHDPQVRRAPVGAAFHMGSFVRLPFFHVKRI